MPKTKTKTKRKGSAGGFVIFAHMTNTLEKILDDDRALKYIAERRNELTKDNKKLFPGGVQKILTSKHKDKAKLKMIGAGYLWKKLSEKEKGKFNPKMSASSPKERISGAIPLSPPTPKLRKRKVSVVKECPSGKIINPKTNRCVNKKCPSGKIINPKTYRCVNKDSKIGLTLRGKTTKRKLSEYNIFVRNGRLEGKSMIDIAKEWRSRTGSKRTVKKNKTKKRKSQSGGFSLGGIMDTITDKASEAFDMAKDGAEYLTGKAKNVVEDVEDDVGYVGDEFKYKVEQVAGGITIDELKEELKKYQKQQKGEGWW